MKKKYQHLQDYLRSLPAPLCIAVSGGLDSRFLAWACHQGNVPFEAVLIQGPHIPEPESRFAREWLEGLGVPWTSLFFDPLGLSEILPNPKTRCYVCKRAMFTLIAAHGAHGGMATILEGSQASDRSSFRPGMKALEELGILSPLAEEGITKPEIRELAAGMGISWPDQPSRSCLLARFAYDLVLDHALLGKVAAVETMLLELGMAAFRFRVLTSDTFLLQVHTDEGPVFKKHRAFIATRCAALGVEQWRLELTTRLSGHFDSVPGAGAV